MFGNEFRDENNTYEPFRHFSLPVFRTMCALGPPSHQSPGEPATPSAIEYAFISLIRFGRETSIHYVRRSDCSTLRDRLHLQGDLTW